MSEEPRPRRPWLQASLLVLAVVLAYLPTLRGDFLYDDVAIRDTGFFRDPWGVTLRGCWDPRGLHNAVVALDVTLWGDKPAGFHLTNLLLHAATVLSAFWAGILLLENLPWGAFLGALLFALHPLSATAVSYVIQRSEVMVGLFSFLTLGCWLKGRAAAGSGRTGAAWAWASSGLLSLLAGQFSKDNAAAIPALVLASALVSARTKAPRRWIILTLGAFFLCAGALAVLFHRQLLSIPSPGTSATPAGWEWGVSRSIPMGMYFATQFGVVARYLRLCALPLGQRLDYDWGLDHDPLAFRPALGLAGILLLLSLAWRARRSFPLAAWGLAWFLIALAPTSSLVPIDDVIMEHRVYTALWGPALAVAAWAAGRRNLLLLPLACLALLTAKRNFAWARPEAIWGETARLSPRCSRAWEAWGGTVRDLGWPEAGAKGLALALAANADNYRAAHNLGRIRAGQGRHEEAVALYEQSIRAFPDTEAILDLSVSLWKLGRDPEAVPILRNGRRLYPKNAMLPYNEGTALLRVNRPGEAIEPLQTAARLLDVFPQRKPPFDPRLGLAEALGRTNRPAEARATVEPLLASPDRLTRRAAWETYRKACLFLQDAEGIRRADAALR